MDNLVAIGNRIKSLREKAKLTQSDVARYLSLDQSMIAKMEKGERKITLDVVKKLSALFCCTVDYILTGEDADQVHTISFRTNNLDAEDLKALARINKIVLNQFEMDKMWELIKNEEKNK